jgi:hypothetical protein
MRHYVVTTMVMLRSHYINIIGNGTLCGPTQVLTMVILGSHYHYTTF